jgi:hypothetical protein
MRVVILQSLALAGMLVFFMFVARLVCSPFSEKIQDQMRRHPVWHWLWAVLAVASGFFLYALIHPSVLRPNWLERRTQHDTVLQRVQSAGGWEALRRDCISLAQTNEMVRWIRWHTNGAPVMPPAILALKPQEVSYYSPKVFGPKSGELQIPVVRVKVFGMHSTGGHSTPYFGLEVIASDSTEGYAQKAHPAVPGNGFEQYRKVSEGVFEIY